MKTVEQILAEIDKRIIELDTDAETWRARRVATSDIEVAICGVKITVLAQLRDWIQSPVDSAKEER